MRLPASPTRFRGKRNQARWRAGIGLLAGARATLSAHVFHGMQSSASCLALHIKQSKHYQSCRDASKFGPYRKESDNHRLAAIQNLHASRGRM